VAVDAGHAGARAGEDRVGALDDVDEAEPAAQADLPGAGQVVLVVAGAGGDRVVARQVEDVVAVPGGDQAARAGDGKRAVAAKEI
jgi:hypothetical protein